LKASLFYEKLEVIVSSSSAADVVRIALLAMQKMKQDPGNNASVSLVLSTPDEIMSKNEERARKTCLRNLCFPILFCVSVLSSVVPCHDDSSPYDVS